MTTKQTRKKQKPGTHFEQVPLAVVKKIAGGDASTNGAAGIEPSGRDRTIAARKRAR